MERALENSEARNGDRVLDDSVVLAGFSQGAYAIASLVRDLALHPSDVIHLRGVVVQGAAVHLSPADVRALGIRIALVAPKPRGSSVRGSTCASNRSASPKGTSRRSPRGESWGSSSTGAALGD
jgi:hypothetical protein